jgi:hypothetical protein
MHRYLYGRLRHSTSRFGSIFPLSTACANRKMVYNSELVCLFGIVPNSQVLRAVARRVPSFGARAEIAVNRSTLFRGHYQDAANMASIDKQASRIARASFAVAPITPRFPRGLTRNQNQALSRLHITKSTPKWRLRSHEPALTRSPPRLIYVSIASPAETWLAKFGLLGRAYE